MSTMLFKRTGAAVIAVIAIGSAGAVSLPGMAAAATTHPIVSHSAKLAQARQQPNITCPPWPRWVCWPD